MTQVRLGLRENLAQFSLLVVVNAFVGAMIGMERTLLSPIAEQEFHLAAKSAVLSFIVVFGVTKALTNYLAGRLSDRFGRKHVLVGGWLVAAPVPFLLMWAPSWSWVLIANALLGISQGLTWSTTVIMKIDLAGPAKRGLAMGLNEFAGYFAVAGSALATGFIAAHYGLRPQPFYLGIAFVTLGLLLSALAVRETKHHVAAESKLHGELPAAAMPSQHQVFWRTTLLDRDLSSVTQAGLVNNLNDGMAWGLFPLFFAAAGMRLEQIGTLAAIYPATWGIAQLFTGAWSDRIGRKWLIASGMWVQAVGIAFVVLASAFTGFALGAALLGVGTAMVYPTLLAAIGDVAHPSWRASSVGVYRLWRDLGYAIGALLAGVTADAFGLPAAMWLVTALTFASGLIVAVRMTETLRRPARPLRRLAPFGWIVVVCLLLAAWFTPGPALASTERASDAGTAASGACGVSGTCALEPAETLGPAEMPEASARRVTLLFFWGIGCPHCEEAKPFIERLRRERPELDVEAIEVRKDPVGRRRFADTRNRLQVGMLGIPTFVVGEHHLIGFTKGVTEAELERLVDEAFGRSGPATPGRGDGVQTKLFGWLSATELGLPLFTIAIGLLDGFNPCAMWVLLFLLAMLAGQRDRTRMAVTAGTFVLVSGVVYFAFMAAWLSVFLVVGMTRPVQLVLGAVALGIGAVNLKDFFAFGHGPSLSIPASVKPGIYARVRSVLREHTLVSSLLGVAALAVLVNFVELLCTAGLPAIYTSILAKHALSSWGRMGYLALYNLAYIADDSLMVTLAVVTLSRRRLAETAGRWLKLVSGAVMLALGVLLLLRPEWLP